MADSTPPPEPAQLDRVKPGHVPVLDLAIDAIRPSPENDRIYRPFDPADPAIIELVQSIQQLGIKEPIVVTTDGWILSGHRRHAAARIVGLREVPCRIEPIDRENEPDRFVRLLREYNRQRDKTRDEILREEVISTDPEEAYESLIEYRRQQSELDTQTIEILGKTHRCRITKAKAPFLAAIQRVIKSLWDFWPLSDRRIHYCLLNDPPLRHASKPQSKYKNTPQSYKSLVDLLTRARLAGGIPMHAIADETRPIDTWETFPEPRAFIRRQLDEFLKGYWRDLMQSQPNQIEIVGEKNTIASILEPVAMRYCIPLTTGRGYCSLPPRNDMAQRFRLSGKEQLVLLIVSDFDPDGEEIAHSFARSMRDDFGIEAIHPIKVALTADQVREHALPPGMKAKRGSVNRSKFVERHGDNVFELEALEPKALQQILTQAIDSVLDAEAFNHELEQEKADAAYLEGVRRVGHDALSDAIDDEEDEW